MKEENFTKTLVEEWLQNNILMHSTYNEGTSVIAERFIKRLKTKMYEKDAS